MYGSMAEPSTGQKNSLDVWIWTRTDMAECVTTVDSMVLCYIEYAMQRYVGSTRSSHSFWG